MPASVLPGKNVDIRVWADPDEIEESARRQLENISALPWAFHHVAVMPDVHFGKGATVGSVIAMKDAVSPAAVGVDIGCGMAAVRTNVKAHELPDNLRPIRNAIEKAIPVGFQQHKSPTGDNRLKQLMSEFNTLDPDVHRLREKAACQLGTLGGGNHFIELCLDQQQRVWLLLHSGSRNIGKTLADIHIARAKKLAHNADLPDPDLAVFLAGTREMARYRHDLFWAQRYAAVNREIMIDLYMKALRPYLPHIQPLERVACHHNYVAEEHHFGEEVLVTRKGAIRAGKGDLGIIPGSMGARSFIVEGLGNPDSFESASHGAGRRMSRNQAKKRFKPQDLIDETAGVECRKDAGVLDEIPSAYKDIQQVIDAQKDLVAVREELRQVLCVKG